MERIELRQIDALVAEHVMGWHLRENLGAAGGKLWHGHGGGFGDMPEHWQPEFSTEIEDAWKVVEKMREHPDARYRTLFIVAYSYNRTYATFDAEARDDDKAWTEANGDNAAPMAICLAALKAHGVPVFVQSHKREGDSK